ncbi:LytTR family DNA-binding domain-containing protein [Ligilactobacillus equi]|uniref:HTH LytTR-type domain-containing protein n=1 Tax=Ligilactobacillus equi DSM 15833 = JCM 10991 TaxID=1423740 RepID=A0A0R1TGD1_9LACO|nr:LytTR family DNA-binding domain-containing protein [Ligilactobacillus equi]KRL80208.1 hypothetical protein FC36_GL000042 [Ligilactobacillus equi DSM 15833 = JCM 10991]MCQ2556995.1 LytTR family transcriptional regulator [Ligilactobacillus sp.]
MKKVSIQIDQELTEDEILVRINDAKLDFDALQKVIKKELQRQTKGQKLRFLQGERQIFPKISEIIFFQTQEGKVHAHSTTEEAEVNLKLYELEEILPENFLRISKSGIVNVDKIYALSRSLTGNLLEFRHSQKSIYVSRRYLRMLEELMEKRF